jgi:lysophospholipid acyltransferase (LPLAT)-like uncharacterized protein
MSYRVDTVPWPVRPFYLAIAWACGLAVYLYFVICRWTSTISIVGPGNHDLSQHAIFCVWHQNWWAYSVVFVRYRSPHATFSHPAAYMKPVHTAFRLMGLKPLLLGSSGEEGRRAADEIARLVQRGSSTTISPDGPYGPARILKKGVLHVALKSGVPIVPLTIAPSRYVSWPSWDSKRFPIPFGRVQVTVHSPITVNQTNFEEAGRLVVAALGGPGGSDHAAAA